MTNVNNELAESIGDVFIVDMTKAMFNEYEFAKGFYGYRVVASNSDLGLVFGFPVVAAVRFDLTGLSDISFVFDPAPYHTIYAITDNNDNVLEFINAQEDSGSYEKTIRKMNMPSGAKYIYFCSYTTNLEVANIKIRWNDNGLFDQNIKTLLKLNNTLDHQKQLDDYTVWNYVWANTGSWVHFTDNDSFVYNVSGFDVVIVTMRRPPNNYFSYISFVNEDGSIIHLTESGGEAEITRKFLLPAGTKYIVVFHYKAQSASTVTVMTHSKDEYVGNQNLSRNTKALYGHWSGRDFVWFGTSIPAGGTYRYPSIVGDILNTNVYNESVGSSTAHCRQKNLVSDLNPYGFISNFSACSRCLSNSIEEMQWIIDNWNSGVFTQEVPSAMTDELSTSIIMNSYETKLLKYFNQKQFYRAPDLIVFNHGYNDIMDYEDLDYKVPFETIGSESITGGYQYHSGESEPRIVPGALRIEYDVTGIDSVEINTVTGMYLDVWDIFNGNTFVGSSGMSYQTIKQKIVIKVSNATKLVLTIPSGTDSNEIRVYDYSYFTDRFTFNGAMNFLFTQIKTRCPKARIVMIGEYANETRELVVPNQKKVADRWDIPLYDQWDMLQFSNNFIWTTYGWSNGEFKPDVFPDGHYMSEINMYLPDVVHPHSDTTGQVTNYIAQNMAKWIDTIYPFEYNW